MKKSTQKTKKLRFAVVGLGNIAQVAVLPAFAHAKRDVELTALVSGEDLKLRRLGKRYKVENLFRYEEYDTLLESDLVDAVYIALPNSMHVDFTVRALERGIHVLCEKPLALTEADCRKMVKAAEKNNALLMTAYRLHFEKANLTAMKLAQEKLGELRYFNSTFGYQMKDRDNIRLEAKEGGHPVWDVGVYCINAARYFFRSEPISVSAIGAEGRDARFSEILETVSVTMKFPQERLAQFTCSFGAGASAAYDLLGTKGRIHMENAYEYVEPREMQLQIGDKRSFRKFARSDQFAPELIAFAECARTGRRPEASGVEGWADVRIILAIEKAMRSGKTVRLGATPTAIENKRRPDLKMLIERPPVRKPKIVEAPSPSG